MGGYAAWGCPVGARWPIRDPSDAGLCLTPRTWVLRRLSRAFFCGNQGSRLLQWKRWAEVARARCGNGRHLPVDESQPSGMFAEAKSRALGLRATARRRGQSRDAECQRSASRVGPVSERRWSVG